mmetsp:Transcript_67045/g.218285  ORF Transcript_67045/g.218285 Transcript_67045/m.218285 type:complete len:530 (-) Transcript_67045:55-1644(-)
MPRRHLVEPHEVVLVREPEDLQGIPVSEVDGIRVQVTEHHSESLRSPIAHRNARPSGSLLEMRGEHRCEVFRPSRQNIAVSCNGLPVHHEGDVGQRWVHHHTSHVLDEGRGAQRRRTGHGDAVAGHEAGGDQPDPVPARLRHHDVAVAVHGHARGVVEHDGRRRAIGLFSVSSQGDHVAVDPHLAYTIVAEVRDHAVPGAVDGHAHRRVEGRRLARAVREARLPAARQGRHHAVHVDAADAVVAAVSDQHATVGGDGHVDGAVEASPGRRSVRVAGLPAAREGADRAVDGDPADAVVETVSDEDVAVTIHGQTLGPREASIGARAVREVLFAATGQSGHCPVARDLTNALVACVCDDHVVVAVHRQTERRVEEGSPSRAICEVAPVRRPGDRRDPPVARDPPDARLVGHEDVAVAVNRDAPRVVEAGVGTDAVLGPSRAATCERRDVTDAGREAPRAQPTGRRLLPQQRRPHTANAGPGAAARADGRARLDRGLLGRLRARPRHRLVGRRCRRRCRCRGRHRGHRGRDA